MSDKFEYSDFYKFITSVGVALIVFAFAIPWAFLREKFDLLVGAETMKTLSPEAAKVISQRQHISAVIFEWLPVLFGVTLFLGFLFLVVGSTRWWLRQIWRDRAENAATKKAEQELQPLTVAQKEIKANVEVSDANVALETASTEPSAKSSGALRSYLDLESRVGERLSSCLSQTHQVLSQQRIGAAQFDFILQDRNSRTADLVIELKVRMQPPNFSWWIENVRRTAISCETYTATTRRAATPFLLVIVKGSSELSHRMVIAGPRVSEVDPSLAKVKIIVVTEAEFLGNDCYDCRRLFGV